MTSTGDDAPAIRFIPGQVLAERYRVVERIGHGGMGEVYRADDLRLGQPVALKFLAESVGRDAQRLEALLGEVRFARQVSHAHVCRVHDIVEVDGALALSMEFVDGEDIASLLRRIGRLPGDKAVLLMHEICAGLAAIHERGVLHRDLKPANVMVDGRGHARITDFGLAALQGQAGDPQVVAGTPAYMAPESFAGSYTVQSDLYGLGLLMYEVFTGRPAHQAASLGELIRLRAQAPPPPSKIQSDLDPRIDRIVLRCLEPDPARRPRSVREVVAALPGSDPLAAAIARGDTPSPALVAAATPGAEGLSRAAAWSCLLALAAGLAAVTAISPLTRLVPRLPLQESPQVMASRASETLREHGHRTPPVDRAFGYHFDEAAVDRIATTDRSISRWEALRSPEAAVVTFWYRESPRELVPSGPRYRAAYDDPPWGEGMVGAQLDGTGRPVRIDAPGDASLPVTPPSGSGAAPATPSDPSARTARFVNGTLRPSLFLAAMFFGAWLARRNLRAGRGDPRRAVRVASALAAFRIADWLLGGHHTAGSATAQVMSALAWSFYDFAYAWVFYVAIEPYMRRLWPRVLTAWVRLVDGLYADARVGRDLLIGCVTGAGLALLVAAHQAAPMLFGAPPGRPDNVGYVEHQLSALLGVRAHLAEVAWLLRSNIMMVMGFAVILVTARLVLRRPGASLVAAFMIFVPLGLPKGELVALNLGLAAGATLLLLWVMMRFGLLAASIGLVTHTILQSAPLGVGSWQVAPTLFALTLVFGVGAYGFARSLERRGAIGDVIG